MGIAVVAGGEFTRGDNETAPLAAVVNEMMAAQFWHGKDPVRQRVQGKGRWMQVVGVAKMSKYRNLTEIARPFFYVPMRQNTSGLSLNIRTSLRPETMATALTRDVHALH